MRTHSQYSASFQSTVSILDSLNRETWQDEIIALKRDIYRAVQEIMGIKDKRPELLSLKNAKIYKSNKSSEEFLSLIMHLAPFTTSRRGNTCVNATRACMKFCLNESGHALMFKSIHTSRQKKTQLFFDFQSLFMAWLELEIMRARKYADSQGKILALRLNGTSDLEWETFGIMNKFRDVVFYDYTKSYERMDLYLNGGMPKNYWLTYSATESNQEQCADVLSRGGNVAMIFRRELPTQWEGARVIDGTLDDLRFLDETGVIVGLLALAKAKKDQSGMVRDYTSLAAIAA